MFFFLGGPKFKALLPPVNLGDTYGLMGFRTIQDVVKYSLPETNRQQTPLKIGPNAPKGMDHHHKQPFSAALAVSFGEGIYTYTYNIYLYIYIIPLGSTARLNIDPA